jgi:hypothetical protein
MMDNVVRNLRVVWRAESIIADIHLRQLLMRSSLRGAAAFAGLVAVLMMNLAGYFALEQAWGAIWASVGIGLINLSIAGLLLALAGRSLPGRELQLAIEVRDTALKALELDALAAQKQLVEIRDEIRGVRQVVAGFVRNPLDAVLPSVLVPLAGAVVKSIAKPIKDKE